MILGQRNRLNPELADHPFPSNVHVRRFVAVEAVKVEPVRTAMPFTVGILCAASTVTVQQNPPVVDAGGCPIEAGIPPPAFAEGDGWPDVLETLRPFLEPESVPDKEAAVRACHRYISNRTNFLDYKGALAAGLPIGSGEIESAHRYVIQIRIKIAGAWWKLENLSKMLALRVLRANRGWEHYWHDLHEKAA